MRLLDTVALVASINPGDRLHRSARQHMEGVVAREDTFVPAAALLEFDLELKSHGFTPEERVVAFEDLAPLIPRNKVLAPTVTAMASAVRLASAGMSYFDALVSSLAQETGAVVVTTDRAIAKHVPTEW